MCGRPAGLQIVRVETTTAIVCRIKYMHAAARALHFRMVRDEERDRVRRGNSVHGVIKQRSVRGTSVECRHRSGGRCRVIRRPLAWERLNAAVYRLARNVATVQQTGS
jgi:hypothetical protein